MKKGFIFSFDSFLALIIFTLFTLLIYLFFVFSSPATQQYYFSEDMLNVLQNVKISELQDSYPEINQMVIDGRIKDTEINILEQMLTFELENKRDDACILFNETTNNLLPESYKISFDLSTTTICGEQAADAVNLISRNRLAIGRKSL